jgi:hypothetical protein
LWRAATRMRSRRISPHAGLSLRRCLGIGFGVITQGLFFFTVWELVQFLNAPQGSSSPWFARIDFCLVGQFAITQSLWLWPPVRQRLGRQISRSFYGSSYRVMTCLSLLLVFGQWRTSPVVIWQLDGNWASVAVVVAFVAAWIALFYSLSLTGLGYQTGLTEWICWLAKRPPPRREFIPRGAYVVLLHPVYLSFLGLLWFTPTMTLDHALLTAVWSLNIFIGSWLKDQRLAYYLDDTYRPYAARVPGYPGMGVGPLACWRTRQIGS